MEFYTEFVDEYYEDIYNCICEKEPELIKNSDVTLEDIPDITIEKVINTYMLQTYNIFCDNKTHKLLDIDDKCKEILALQLKKSSANKVSSRSSLLSSVDSFIVNNPYYKVVELLKKQKYYKFNVDKVLARITQDCPVSQVIAPVIVAREDVDSIGKHILLESIPKEGDEVLHILPLDPDCLGTLLNKCEELDLDTAGINSLSSRSDSPTTIIYGRHGFVEEHKNVLMKTYKNISNKNYFKIEGGR